MSVFKTLSITVAVFSILLGYTLNYSPFRYNVGKKLIERTFNERFSYNKILFCMIYSDGSLNKFGDSSKKECDGSIKILNENLFFEKLLMSFPAVGIGESYIEQYWDVSDGYDLGDVLTLLSVSSFNRNPMIENKIHLNIIKYILNLLSISKWTDWYERSTFGTHKTKKEDAKTISHHYDIGNEFYQMFLDKTMTYSCAIFDNNHNITELNDAQVNKMNILINKMNIKKKGAKILDIGSGWGFTASHFQNVSSKYDVKLTGITLSKQQLKYSQDMYADAIAKNNLEFIYKDYRNYLDPRHKNYFDGIISIGMLEHVHLRRLDEFFNVTSYIMKEGAVMGLHYITRNDIYPLNVDINNGYYPYNGLITRKRGCGMVTFISKYIFPGGCLLPSDWVHESAKKHGLVQLHKESYGLHYAKTLNLWRANFNKNWNKNTQITKKFKYDDNLFRVWNLYLANCEAVFRVQYADLVQQIFVKSNHHNNFRDISNINQQIPVDM